MAGIKSHDRHTVCRLPEEPNGDQIRRWNCGGEAVAGFGRAARVALNWASTKGWELAGAGIMSDGATGVNDHRFAECAQGIALAVTAA